MLRSKRPIHPLFPEGYTPQGSAADSRTVIATQKKKVSSKQRKSYQRSVLHRATLAAPSLPHPQDGSLRQAALASVERLQAAAALLVCNQSAKKRPFPYSPNAPSPSHLSPLEQRIRKDIQVGESEVDSPEKEVLRTSPFLENSPSPCSPCSKGIPSPSPLVSTPRPVPANCLNCESVMTPNHQCPAPFSRSVDEGLVLPLCHYCCHRGSGLNPVQCAL